MDDPWGSPWATTDSNKDQKLGSSAKSDLAPPPRAFLSASSSPRISAVLDQSPWAGDDDGFGEWATTPDAPPVQAVWAGGWGASSPNLAATPRDDVLGKASPIAWPGALATPKPTNGSMFRQPSPDPWASGFSSRRASNAGVSTPRLVLDAASPADAPTDTLESDGLRIGIDSGQDASDAGQKSKQSTISGDPVPRDPEPAGAIEAETRPSSTPGSDVRASVEWSAQSREFPSSTPSNYNTDHEDEPQDSPITSIDEGPRARPSESRKASGKVQELVVKFDGLARALSQERVPVQRGRSTSPFSVRKQRDPDDGADFGDFEDADQDEPPLHLETSAATPAGEEAVVIDTLAASPQQPTSRQPSTASPIAMFGPINFDVDLTLLDKLFETGVPEAANNIQADRGISDHIISDSFTQISERKTWYRISRLGSSRRHNAADDDSYRRVLWRTSTVHDDTTKIVRRWMEEDSIAGRVTLGGGISKTQKNMFGWDSSAEPVALDAVFGKRKPHSRASSLQTSQMAPLSLEGVGGHAKKSLRGLAHRPSGSAGPAVASFGWSSSSPASAGAKHTSDTIPGPPNAAAPLSRPPSSIPHIPSVPVLGVVPPKERTITIDRVLVPPAQEAGSDDDDDDWGEMVSSPVVPNHSATDSAVPGFASVPVSAILEPKTSISSGAGNFDAPSKNDPWGSADCSLFELAPTRPPLPANTPTTVANCVESPSNGSAPALPSEVAATLPTLTAVPVPFEPQTTDLSNISTAPSKVSKDLGPPADANALAGPPQDDHDEVADRIISSLPDFSYMLR
jgi:hypothetical protein